MFNKDQQKALLDLARAAIKSKLLGTPIVRPSDEAFKMKRGVFVSLHKHGELRGCIGYIQGYRNLVDSVIEMAQSAAFNDPRFNEVKAAELPDLEIEISILSELIPVQDVSEIVIGRDGLLLQHPYGSGLLLPQVAVEWKWDVPEFLKHLCYKAGLPQESYKDPQAKLFRFTAIVFSDSQQNSH